MTILLSNDQHQMVSDLSSRVGLILTFEGTLLLLIRVVDYVALHVDDGILPLSVLYVCVLYLKLGPECQ